MAVRRVKNSAAMNQLLTGPEGPVAKALIIRGTKVQTLARKNLGGAGTAAPKRVDTGLLRASIDTRLLRGVHGSLIMRVGSRVYYALWVHEGTGIYGPKMQPIRPVTRSTLKFTVKGETDPVYARSVKGMKPNRYLTNALKSLNLKSHPS